MQTLCHHKLQLLPQDSLFSEGYMTVNVNDQRVFAETVTMGTTVELVLPDGKEAIATVELVDGTGWTMSMVGGAEAIGPEGSCFGQLTTEKLVILED